MKLLQINVTANWGSTGKIAEQIGRLAIEKGWESYIAYGRGEPDSDSQLLRIGSDLDMRLHGVETRILDNHGLASRKSTRTFIETIQQIAPDIIHLHNIHGYFLNYPLLFDFLKKWGGPVVWTLHDCWPFTGHCAYYDYAACNRWESACHNCPQLRAYPASFLCDRSAHNFEDKRKSFLECQNLTLVPVSEWLKKELNRSFLAGYRAITIHNGVDLNVFKPSLGAKESKTILGVASVWEQRKGLSEFINLRASLPTDYRIILIGLTKKQIKKLPEGIQGISRTENVGQLVDLYSKATVFVNPTLEDNFPTTNLEALACGTPVITYRTGGSPEAVDARTGIVVEKGNIKALTDAIKKICNSSDYHSEDCRHRAESMFDRNVCFTRYLELYKTLL